MLLIFATRMKTVDRAGWPQNSNHYINKWERFEAEHPQLSNVPSSGETIETDDSWLEECAEANIF